MLVKSQPGQLETAPKKTYKVAIRYVKDVSPHDYPQAKKAWDALVEAGIDPGQLVSEGLSVGHGYQIEDMGLFQSFSVEAQEELLAQNISSETSLVAYKYAVDQGNRLVLPESLENGSNSPYLSKTNELIIVQDETVDTIEMVAVMPRGTQHLENRQIQIGETTGGFSEER